MVWNQAEIDMFVCILKLPSPPLIPSCVFSLVVCCAVIGREREWLTR